MSAQTTAGSAVVTLPTDTQILITREFDAPKHLLYKVWTTPELVRRWWHANRGEVTQRDIDLERKPDPVGERNRAGDRGGHRAARVKPDVCGASQQQAVGVPELAVVAEEAGDRRGRRRVEQLAGRPLPDEFAVDQDQQPV